MDLVLKVHKSKPRPEHSLNMYSSSTLPPADRSSTMTWVLTKFLAQLGLFDEEGLYSWDLLPETPI